LELLDPSRQVGEPGRGCGHKRTFQRAVRAGQDERGHLKSAPAEDKFPRLPGTHHPARPSHERLPKQKTHHEQLHRRAQAERHHDGSDAGEVAPWAMRTEAAPSVGPTLGLQTAPRS